jgi:hypothetical protein
MNDIHDLSFSRPKLDFTKEEFESLSEAVKKAFDVS